jgi:Bacterial PH domain/YvbH-like oligomerisation region
MFGKLAADALGLSDVGSVIAPADFNKVDADDYVMHEDEEKIFFLIKSKADEYCFTNTALIHLDGTSAASKKRMLRRFSYVEHRVTQVMLETAGTIDMDVELKFHIGEHDYSIDVHKKHIEQLKDLYKALIRIGELQAQGEIALENARMALGTAASVLNRAGSNGAPVVETLQQLTQASFDWLAAARKRYVPKDFGAVYERYIRA